MCRRATIKRKTNETEITVTTNLDGTGSVNVHTGIGFFDHMLTLVGGHGLIDLEVMCDGDLHVDGHHSVEDVGRAFGTALKNCLGDRSGIRRYGHAIVPMDESLVTAAVDFGGRSACVMDVVFPAPTIGTFDTELVEVFWESVTATAGANIHAVLHHGRNGHHIAEAVFKAISRAIRTAVESDPRQDGIASTKGTLTMD